MWKNHSKIRQIEMRARAATRLDIHHRHISRRIHRMNKRMEQEIGENIIVKHGHRWKLIPRLRRDFAAAR